ncbi:hypothetical protein [Streptomyces sp. NPDC014894]|uniref:hypothetical protein n=1 Tax=Streptomyces sp. NPDC014894 TaxID=3364931 RepID=UPI0036FAE778
MTGVPARPDRRSPAAFPAGGHETVVAEAVDLSPLREEQPLAFRRGGRPCPEALV